MGVTCPEDSLSSERVTYKGKGWETNRHHLLSPTHLDVSDGLMWPQLCCLLSPWLGACYLTFVN